MFSASEKISQADSGMNRTHDLLINSVKAFKAKLDLLDIVSLVAKTHFKILIGVCDNQSWRLYVTD